jgi:hypothetical protein
MIMHVIGVRFQKLVQKYIEGETLSLFEKQIVAFQVRFVVYAIIHNAFAT